METNWQESIDPNETTLFDAFAQKLVAIQKKHSASQGNGRALHRKPILGLQGRFQVRADLPVELRQGICAAPLDAAVLIRLSNGAQRKQKDGIPDIRGFAFRILGVSGPGALGNGPVDSQDFLCIDRSTFGLAHVKDFMELVEAVEESPLKIFGLLRRKFGFWGMFRMLRQLGILPPKKFTSFATENFYTAAPICWGPYAARLRLVPKQPPGKKKGNDFRADILAWLAASPLSYEVQAQFFIDSQSTPIENHAINWSSPYVALGTLTIDQQPAADEKLQSEIEALKFDPWNALETHRPLGNVMRARKAAYYASAKERSQHALA